MTGFAGSHDCMSPHTGVGCTPKWGRDEPAAGANFEAGASAAGAG
jgi:hypothetical protein